MKIAVSVSLASLSLASCACQSARCRRRTVRHAYAPAADVTDAALTLKSRAFIAAVERSVRLASRARAAWSTPPTSPTYRRLTPLGTIAPRRRPNALEAYKWGVSPGSTDTRALTLRGGLVLSAPTTTAPQPDLHPISPFAIDYSNGPPTHAARTQPATREELMGTLRTPAAQVIWQTGTRISPPNSRDYVRWPTRTRGRRTGLPDTARVAPNSYMTPRILGEYYRLWADTKASLHQLHCYRGQAQPEILAGCSRLQGRSAPIARNMWAQEWAISRHRRAERVRGFRLRRDELLKPEKRPDRS